jgi:hypothetical protein
VSETDKPKRQYRPPRWGHAYVCACLDWTIQPTKTARCEAIQISRAVLWEAEKKPEFIEWLNAQLDKKTSTYAQEIKAALFRKCIGTGPDQLEAIRLYFAFYENRTAENGTGSRPAQSDGPLTERDLEKKIDDLEPGVVRDLLGVLDKSRTPEPRQKIN